MEKSASDYLFSKEDELKMLIALWNRLSDEVISLSKQINGVSVITVLITLIVSGVYIGNNVFLLTFSAISLPFILLVAMGIFSFNLRVDAYLRGYLAGVEDAIADITGKNILIKNRGFEKLYNFPYFITNNALCPMLSVFAAPLVIMCFYFLFLNYGSNIGALIIIIIYAMVFVLSSITFIFEMSTNKKAKDRARTYFHLNYNNRIIFDPGNIIYERWAVDPDFDYLSPRKKHKR